MKKNSIIFGVLMLFLVSSKAYTLIPAEFIIGISSQIISIFALAFTFLTTFFIAISQHLKKLFKLKKIPVWSVIIVIVIFALIALAISFGIHQYQTVNSIGFLPQIRDFRV